MSSSESKSAAGLELAEEFLERYRQGQRPSLKEYADRHPELAGEIREVFPAMALMENIALDDESLAAAPPGPGPAIVPAPLQQLGDFRIIREVGHGGMGIVYEAEQVSLGRHVALKVLSRRLQLDARQARRFEREARAAAKLHHTNIVPVFGVGEQDGLPYYVMQFIQGRGLDEVIEELRRLPHSGQPATQPEDPRQVGKPPDGDLSAADVARSLLTGEFQPAVGATVADTPCPADPGGAPPPVGTPAGHLSDTSTASSSAVVLSGQGDAAHQARGKKPTYWQAVAKIGVQVAGALGHAHGQGVLHRDIKPSNLLLDTRGAVWVTDFGLAKAEDQQDLTHTGDIVGTLRYMPPEAFEGRADARGDVYSLGLTLYELLACRPAFDEKERNRLIKQVTQQEPARLGKLNRQVPRDLETIVHKAIDRDPGRRYASAGALAEDLQRFLEDEPIRARRVGVAERGWRWCRHNRALAALAAAVALLLVGVAAVSTVSAVRIARARDEALRAGKNEADQRRRAERSAEESRQRLVLAQVAGGAGLMERGDLHSALPWFAEALRLDQGDPAREENHRLRLAATLQHAPKLVALWTGEAGAGRAAFCPDGRRVAVSDAAGLHVWYVAGDRPPLTLAKASAVTDFVFSPDGSRVATAGKDWKARVWDLETGEPVTPPLGHWGPVNRVAFSPDGRRLLTAGDDRTARLWDAATGKQLRSFYPHTDAVRSASFSPDGKRVVTQSRGMVRVWEVAGGKVVAEFPSDQGPFFQDAVFSADGRRIIETGGGTMLRTSDADTGRVLFQVQQQGRTWLNPDRSRAVSGYSDQPAQGWDVLTGQPVTPPLQDTRMTMDCAFSAQGDRLVTTGYDGTVRVWDPEAGEVVAGPLRHASAVTSATFSPDGRLLVTRDSAGQVRVWDLAGSTIPVSPLNSGILSPFTWFSPDGHWQVTTTPHGTYASLWDARTGRLVRTLHEQGHVMSAAVGPDGRCFLTGDLNGVARIWQAATGVCLGTVTHGGWVSHVAFSPDGRLVATASRDGTACVVDAATGKRLAEMKHGHAVRWATFSPDGRRLVTATGDYLSLLSLLAGDSSAAMDLFAPQSDPRRPGEARVWDVATGRPITEPIHHGGAVQRASFSPDGRWLLTTCVSRTADRYQVRVWDAATGQPVTPPLVHPQTVWHETFSPDGRLVATACADGGARIWDVAGGKALPVLAWHGGAVRHVTFSPDSRRLLTASDDGTARLWDATTGQPIALLRHPHAVWDATFAADGYSVITGCMDGTGRLWPLPPPDRRSVADWVALAGLLTGGGWSPGFSRSSKPAEAGTPTTDEDSTSAWQTLRTKYPGDFATTKAEQLAWHRAALESASRKNAWRTALAHLDRLTDLDPADWQTGLARARLLARLGRPDEAEAAFTHTVERCPNVAQAWVARGSFALSRGQRDRAEADFVKAFDLRASTEPPVVPSEFWVAGLYPSDLKAPFPPETQTDPSLPIPANAGEKSDLPVLPHWRPEIPDANGFLDLGACFDGAEHISAYALVYVYAKMEQDVVLLSGSDDDLRLWLNGRLVFEYPQGRQAAPDQDHTPVTLRAGWNVVLAKVLNGVGAHGLYLRLSADPQEKAALLLGRGRLHARAAQWRQAADDYTRALALDPDSHDAWYELAAVRLQLGDRDGHARHCREMLRRFGRTPDPYQAERTAKACLIVPDAVADADQLVRLVEQALAGTEKEAGYHWFLLSRGIADCRAGRPQQAIDWIHKGRHQYENAPPAYVALGQLFLSMAYHQLHEADKARAALDEAARIMDRQFPKEDSGDLGDTWLDWVCCQVVRREAEALLAGKQAESKH